MRQPEKQRGRHRPDDPDRHRKRKKKEWVHIYIAECDARRLTQMPAPLTAALSALSDRVRIIPMSDDESGTCIIEMPDEIVDASAATQLDNLRTILMDAEPAPGGSTSFDRRTPCLRSFSRWPGRSTGRSPTA